MKRYFLLLAVAALSSLFSKTASAGTLPYPFSVIPEPQSVKINRGKGFKINRLIAIRISGIVFPPILGPSLTKLPIDNIKGSLSLVIDSFNYHFNSNEAYQLRITADSIQVIAKTEAGLFYGCQTLEQLLEDAQRYRHDLPSMEISDFPSMTYRAVHFDLKHHLDHINYYYESIDRLARYKINAVIIEFEDKLRYKRQPLVGAPHAMSIEEMGALTAYAKKRNIEITPLVQGLGHATYILKHDNYASLRELKWNDWAFCPMNESTYQVLFDLYRDAIKATPGSKYLHIGGDEIGNIGLCTRCQPYVKEHGMDKLHLYWLKKVCQFAADNGRIPIFWDDMPLNEAGLYESTWNEHIDSIKAEVIWNTRVHLLDSLLSQLPNNGIFMRWNYSVATQPGNLLCLDWYKKNNLPVMIATATNAEGGMLFQPDIRDKGYTSAGNSCIKSFIELSATRGIKGMLCTAWDDKSPHMENYWNGFIAAAEYSWSPGLKTLEELDRSWTDKEFGIDIPDWLELQKNLRQGSDLWYIALFEKGNFMQDDNMLQSLKQVEHWLKPVEGRENLPFDYSTKIIDLPSLQSPGQWTNKYLDKLKMAEQVMLAFPSQMERLQELERQSKKNRYYWRLSAALCRFQSATPRVLLALKEIDQKNELKNNLHLASAVNEIKQSFDALVDIYAETRFTTQPEGFVKDRYFHIASQREDLSWMIQAQEIFLEKISRWIKPN